MVCDPNTNPTNNNNSQRGPAAAPGSAGDAACQSDIFDCFSGSPVKCSTPPLPGLEEYFPPLPLELDRCSKSLTGSSKKLPQIPLNEDAQHLLRKWADEDTVNVGACLNIFPSGEITGGFYKTGRKAPPKREGKSVSQEFTRKARKTIRRAVESGIAEFKVFVTLTFDPKKAVLNDSGEVNQTWAKKEFKRFLNTIKKFYDRKGGNHE